MVGMMFSSSLRGRRALVPEPARALRERVGLGAGGADFRSGAPHATSRAHRKVGDLAEPARRARSSAVEHLTFNQVVVGSIPTGLTIESMC